MELIQGRQFSHFCLPFEKGLPQRKKHVTRLECTLFQKGIDVQESTFENKTDGTSRKHAYVILTPVNPTFI